MFGNLQRKDVTLILMLLIVGLVLGTIQYFGSEQLRRQMLEELGENRAVHWGRFVQDRLENIDATLSYGKVSENDQGLIDLISEAGDVFRYKFFSKDGFIVVASRLEDIGLKNTNAYFGERVQRGQTHVEVIKPDAMSTVRELQERRSGAGGWDPNVTVVETYLPFMQNGEFKGAIQIYLDATGIATFIDRAIERSQIGMAVIMAVLAISLTFVLTVNIRDRNRQLRTIQRAHQSMAQAEEEVLKLNEELEQRVAQRTEELNQATAEIKDINAELERRVEERTQQLFERTEQLYRTNDQLYKANESVSKLNQDLEARVEERTAELAKANDDIQQLNEDLEARVEARTSELQATQSELLRTERMAALGQLTATVSHELRNPLGAIRTAVYLIGTRIKDKGLGVENALERADRSIQRCDNIISELLDYTRQTDLALENTGFDEWLKQVLLEQETPSGVVVHDQIATPNLEVAFDQDRLRRVIINLFNNACEAMFEDAEKGSGRQDYSLTVSTRVNNDRLEVLFRDNGPGIPPDVLEKIFEPLYSTKSFGVGLGLPTVRQIMEQHQGGIDISSTVGRGTSVLVWLPLKRLDERAA